MEKGISFYFGFKNDVETRMKSIKDAGFDCIITNADKKFDSQNGTLKTQIKLMKKNGIKPSSLHMQYTAKELPCFWQKGRVGNRMERTLKKDVKLAKKYGFSCVVVHLNGQVNEIGFSRLRRVLKLCEKTKIPLAIENIDNPQCFVKTFENIKSPYLKFCYDSGHNHCYDPEIDYLELYGDKLVCLHLHDNLGKDSPRIVNNRKDLHTLNKYGNIDWRQIAKKLAKIQQPFVLDYELLMIYKNEETAEDVLKEAYAQACELEKMIEKYRTQNKKSSKI